MKTLAKYHVSNHCVIGEKIFKNILIGPGKLPALSRNGPLASVRRHFTSKRNEMKINFTNMHNINIFLYQKEVQRQF